MSEYFEMSRKLETISRFQFLRTICRGVFTFLDRSRLRETLTVYLGVKISIDKDDGESAYRGLPNRSIRGTDDGKSTVGNGKRNRVEFYGVSVSIGTVLLVTRKIARDKASVNQSKVRRIGWISRKAIARGRVTKGKFGNRCLVDTVVA